VRLSRVQAAIERRADGFVLLDRSGRGTRVGPEATEGAPLDDGAEIVLGTWRALFRERAAEDEAATRVSGGTRLHAAGGEVEDADAPERLRVRERGKDRVLRLDGSRSVTVGKDAANDVVLDDPFVSGRHLRLERRDGRWHVRDLGSTNGTFLGGARVVDAEFPDIRKISLDDL
jgi:predicted component of type VI protein secretion system